MDPAASPPPPDPDATARDRRPTPESAAWQIRVFFDGQCPLCRREIDFLRRRDGDRARIAFEDITAIDFDPARHGIAGADLSGRIHGLLPDGRVIDGVEVFRRLYDAVGLGWLLAPTRWPLLRPLADAAYRWFARHRLRLTGRARPSCDDRCVGGGRPRFSGAR